VAKISYRGMLVLLSCAGPVEHEREGSAMHMYLGTLQLQMRDTRRLEDAEIAEMGAEERNRVATASGSKAFFCSFCLRRASLSSQQEPLCITSVQVSGPCLGNNFYVQRPKSENGMHHQRGARTACLFRQTDERCQVI
jgi:hypothetical protein